LTHLAELDAFSAMNEDIDDLSWNEALDIGDLVEKRCHLISFRGLDVMSCL
jgi:hypothetical protein